MFEELRDRFGDPPRPVRRLLEVMRVRALGAAAGARKIYVRKGSLTIEFDKSRLLDHGFRTRLKEAFGDRVQFGMNETASVMLKMKKSEDSIDTTLICVRTFIS